MYQNVYSSLQVVSQRMARKLLKLLSYIYIYIISINLRIYKVYNIIVKDIAFLKKKTKTESCVVHNTVRVTVRETKKKLFLLDWKDINT